MSKKAEKYLKDRVHPKAFDNNLLSTRETIEFMKKYANEQLRLHGVGSNGVTFCKCDKEYLVYNDREGLNVCTSCGKSELA